MKPYDFISVKLSVFLVIGILIGRYSSLPIPTAYIILGISLGFTILLFRFENYRRGIYFGLSVYSSIICLGILVVTMAQPINREGHYSKTPYAQGAIWEVQIKQVLKSTLYSDRYLLAVKKLDGNTRDGIILAQSKKDSGVSAFQVDDRFLFWGKVKPIKPPSNPHQFNYSAYMETLGVYHQLTLTNKNSILIKSEITTFKGMANALHSSLKLSLEKSAFTPRELSFMQAILLGQKEALEPDLYLDYKNAGVAHILAVSGLHIGILLLLFQFLLSPLKYFHNGKVVAMFLVVMMLWVYAFITGLSPSVVRAVTMFSFLSYALYLNRPSNTFNILALSFFFTLIVQPMFLFQVGFQLSYAAVFSILWVYPILIRLWTPGSKLVNKVWQLFSVSLAAQLGVLPLSLYYFHQFPTLFFISNLLIVPTLGFILGFGILILILAAMNSLPHLLASSYNQMLYMLNELVGFIGQQEEFIMDKVAIDGLSMLLIYLLIIFSVKALDQLKFSPLRNAAICLLAIQSYTFYRMHITAEQEVFIITNQFATSGFLYQNGRNLHIMTDNPNRLKPMANAFAIKAFLSSTTYDSIPNAFSYAEKQWMVIDSSAIYKSVGKTPDVIVLTGSPRIHLDRLLKKVKPELVIADGSNYAGIIERWNASCANAEVSFYSTSSSGAYILR